MARLFEALWRQPQEGVSDAKDQQQGNHWLRLRLTGSTCNRDAIGAWVEIDLGDHTQPLTATIHWPNGSVQTIEELQVDRTWDVVHRE